MARSGGGGKQESASKTNTVDVKDAIIGVLILTIGMLMMSQRAPSTSTATPRPPTLDLRTAGGLSAARATKHSVEKKEFWRKLAPQLHIGENALERPLQLSEDEVVGLKENVHEHG